MSAGVGFRSRACRLVKFWSEANTSGSEGSHCSFHNRQCHLQVSVCRRIAHRNHSHEGGTKKHASTL